MIRRIAIAALAAIVLFYTVVFIQMGTVWFFQLEAMKELLMFFIFLVFTFWTHEKVASFFNSNRMAPFPSQAKLLFEGVTVILISLVYSVLFTFIPQFLFIPTIEFTPPGIRLNLVVTAIISLFIYYFVERERGQKKLREEFLRVEQLQKENFKAQLESLKSQINPHFLFNSLNILGSLIYKDPGKAVQFLGQLSKVYRVVLDSGGKQMVTLERELELVNAYIYLLKTRFGENLRFQTDIPLDTMHYLVPPTSVQMLVENAVKHNGYSAEEPLTIRILVADKMLIVTNNVQARLDKEGSTKIGLQNIVNRYRFLTDKPVEIEPTPGEFIVRLPLLEEEL